MSAVDAVGLCPEECLLCVEAAVGCELEIIGVEVTFDLHALGAGSGASTFVVVEERVGLWDSDVIVHV